MPRRFECPECQTAVVTYHRPGELARCQACESEVEVPEGAEHTDDPPGWVSERQARPTPTRTRRRGAAARRSPGERIRRPRLFQVGKVFSKGLATWIKGAHVYVSLTLLVNLPFYYYTWWQHSEGRRTPTNIAEFDVWDWLNVVLNWLLSQLVTATLIYAVFQVLLGRSATMGASLRHVLSRLPLLLAVMLLAGLATITGAAAGALPGLLIMLAADTFGAILAGLGGLVVGLWLSIALWVVLPVAVVEDIGVTAPLRRSWDLTRGFRGRIFLLMLMMGLLGGIVGGIAGAASTALPQLARTLFTLSVNVVIASVGAVVVAVGYHDLRVAAEGLDSEELAAIFD